MHDLFFISSYYSTFTSTFALVSPLNRIETLTQCKMVPQFVVSCFFGNHKIQLLEIMLKHYSEAVCALLLSAARTVIAVAFSAAIHGPVDN